MRQLLFRRTYSGPAFEHISRGEVEQKLHQIRSGILTATQLECALERLCERLDERDLRIESHLKKLDRRISMLQSESQNLKNILSHVTAGLGIKFENFNRAWLNHFLEQKGLSMANIKQGHRERNVAGWPEVEIDLFSKDPAFIVECTSFIDRNEMPKVQKVHKIRDALGSRYGIKFDAYVVALAVHRRIRAELDQYCKNNSIHLITQFS